MSPFSGGRRIGWAGTLSRIGVGVTAIVLPVGSLGITWWDWAAVNVFVVVWTPVSHLILVSFERDAPDAFAARHGLCSGPACALIAAAAAIVLAMSVVTPAHGDVIFWVWLGASMLLGAARGDGGCEVLAFPNAFTGRRDRVGCLVFTPIDDAEARRRARRGARAPSTR